MLMSQPDKVIAVCPSCKAKLAVPATAVGKKIRCPKCQTVVAITEEMVSVKPPTPPDRNSAAPAAATPATPAESPKRPEVSLGAENTFTGPAKKNTAPESLGDEATFGGRRSVDDAVVDDDMEIVDLSARYTIEGVLGKGGMGEVQLATDNRLKRKVAIKRVLGDMAKNQTAVRRFMTEAQSIAALNHPNIVQVYDYGRDKNGPFLILEYVEGKSLLDRCQQGAMPLEEAITLTCYLCDGLSRAHELGIVHRDLKPANVLLTKDGVPKLTDFGLARVETGDTGHTMSGAVLGTLDFMPPEQRRDATQADARSDLWSLAATLYQMVTGKSPKVIRLNEVPTSLQSALGRALEDKPADRYSSVVEFRNALREALNEGQTTLTHLSEGQCPSCGTKNELSRKFCRKCAVSLEMNCLSCSKGMPVWDEVCGSCGTKQSPLITARKEQMQQRQEQAEQFVREGQFREAEQIAAEIHREDDPRFQHLKKWAVDFSEGSKREQRQQQERAGVLHKEARAHQQAYDYASAIHALEQIPAGLRSADINALLKNLQTQEQRSKDLDEEIRVCVERRQLDGLMPRVHELLQLLPDRVDLRELRDTLEQREQQRLAAKNTAKAEAQQLLDARKYAECVAVLQRLDGKLRTPDIETLQKDAASKLSRVQNLQKSIDQGVKNNQLQGLLAKLDELLSLKSEVTVADSQLRGQLLNRDQKQKSQIKALLQKVQQLRKEVRFDEALELLRRVPDELQNDAIMTAVEDLQFFADQRSETIEGLTQAHDQRQIEQALALADEYRGMLTSAIIADTAFESAMKECRQRLEELQQAELVAIRRRQRQKKRILISSVVSLLLLVAVAGLIMLRQQRLTAIADAQQRGDDALQAADFEAAIEAYSEVVRLDDTVADAWAGLALAKLQETPPDVTGAFGDLEKCVALSPDGEKTQQALRLAHVQRAIERANAGSVTEALQDIGEAAELAAPAEDIASAKSAVSSAYLTLAEAAVVAKTPEAAFKELMEARTISPQSDQLPRVSQMIAEAFLDRADASVQQSEVEPALADIEAARAIQPNLPRISELQAAALVIRAQQALQAGDRDKASADFLAAKNLNSSADGLGALAASLADGLVQRCEASFSDAALQEATAALETVSEIDPQSVTLKPLRERLSKVLVTEADKGLQAKETDRVALMIESLTTLGTQPEEQTRLWNDLAGQYYELCQKQITDGDLKASASTLVSADAITAADTEKKQQAITKLLSLLEPQYLNGLQSQSPEATLEALQTVASSSINFSTAFLEQLKTVPEGIKQRLPERFFESFELFATIGEGLPIGATIDRSGSLLALYEESGESGAVLIVDLDHLDRQPVRINAPVRSLGARSFGYGMAFLDQLLLIGEHKTTTRAPHDGTGFVYSDIGSETPKEIHRFYDPGSDRGGRGPNNGLYFGSQIVALNKTMALFFIGHGSGPNIATDIMQFDEAGKASHVGTLEFPYAIQWPAAVQDNVVACLERDKDGAAYLAEYAIGGQVVTRKEIQKIELPGAAIQGSPLFASAGYLAALIPTVEGKEQVLVVFSRRSDGAYETLLNRTEYAGTSHSVSDGFLFLTTRVSEPGVVEGEIRVLNLLQKGQLAEKLPRSSAANVKNHGTHVWAFVDLVVVRDELETGAALRLFRRGFGKKKSSLISTDRNAESAMAQAAPAPAIAPFEATQAKVHQKTWADYLGLPVESTNFIGMKLVVVPPSEFMMGSPETEPGRNPDETLHKVTLTQSFQMGMHEVTQHQYEQVMGSNPSKFKGADNPVEQVTWDDAVAFVAKLSALPAERTAGRVYRLPTEAEWEYACRAGTSSAYSFGDEPLQLGEYAWSADNSGDKIIDSGAIFKTDGANFEKRISANDVRTRNVGLKKPNGWGLYDMHGNVCEWCEDKYGSYPSNRAIDPSGASESKGRVYRAGCCFNRPLDCRSAYRGSTISRHRGHNLGFRVVCDIPRPNVAISQIGNAPSASLSAGLVAYYPFNGDAKDESGNGHNGDVKGASLSNDRHGKSSASYAFDGNDDFIAVPHDPALNLSPGDFSISIWASVTNASAPIHILGKDETDTVQKGQGTKWILNVGSPTENDLNFLIHRPGSSTPEPMFCAPVKFDFSDPAWHQYVVTKTGGRCSIYIDGTLASEGDCPASLDASNKAPLTIGQAENGGWVKGFLDDIRLYKRALSPTEVKTLYEYESPRAQLGTAFLDDLPLGRSRCLRGFTVGLRGESGYSPGNRVTFNGKPVEHAVSMHAHAPKPFGSVAVFNLGGQFTRFTAKACFNGGPADLRLRDKTSFRVFAAWNDEQLSDNVPHGGKQLWESPVASSKNDVFDVDLDISGATQLMLFVDPVGVTNDMTTMWLDPKLYYAVPQSQNRVYLDDLQEVQYRVRRSFTLGKHGVNGYGDQSVKIKTGIAKESSAVIVQGKTPLHCISMHACQPDQGHPADASWLLGRQFSRFSTVAAFSSREESGDPPLNSDVVFKVLGDGELLWSSPKTRDRTSSFPVSVDVSHVSLLTLQVHISGGVDENRVTSVWVNPLLTNERTNQAPPPAVAPFDTTQAKAHQKAWADHLGVSVETTNSIGMKLVVIPAGEYTMGSPAAEPGRQSQGGLDETQHSVILAASYSIGVHEVTQSQYESVMGSNPSSFKGANNPVETISWDDAVAFCHKLSDLPAEKAAGRVYRLPTEAEWEYACRAGTTTAYSFGDDAKDLGEYAWFVDNSRSTTHAVGEKLPNCWGLYDLHGNVWEWCEDKVGSDRVYRGGCWNNAAPHCRLASRIPFAPTTRLSYFGFRVVLSSPSAPVAKAENAASPKSGQAPPAAIAPFDAGQAKAHQQAWADHLGVPIEYSNSLGMKFSLIPPADEQSAARWRTQRQPVYLESYETTQSAYQQVMGDNPSENPGGRFPVELVKREDARAFCKKLTALPAEQTAGCIYRLPTSEEWEYSVRAGTASTYFFGDNAAGLTSFGWYGQNSSLKTTHEVGLKQSNPWGLFDVYGNVWEWTSDGPVRGGSIRGGSDQCISAGTKPSVGDRRDDIGFRVLVERWILN